jgi:hypothetical protein
MKKILLGSALSVGCLNFVHADTSVIPLWLSERLINAYAIQHLIKKRRAKKKKNLTAV